jgi:hypothetical protein
MGHLTNPTGFRLGRSTKWIYRWSSDNLTYYKYYNLITSVAAYAFMLFSYNFKIIRKQGIFLKSFTFENLF